MNWGNDRDKWVVAKSNFGPGWIAFPPHDGEAFWLAEYPFGRSFETTRLDPLQN